MDLSKLFQFDTPSSCPDGVGVRINHHVDKNNGYATMDLDFSIRGPVVGGTKWLSVTFSRPIAGRYLVTLHKLNT